MQQEASIFSAEEKDLETVNTLKLSKVWPFQDRGSKRGCWAFLTLKVHVNGMKNFGWRRRIEDHQPRSSHQEEDEASTTRSRQWKPMKPKFQEEDADDSEFHTGAEDPSHDPENEPDPHPSASNGQRKECKISRCWGDT